MFFKTSKKPPFNSPGPGGDAVSVKGRELIARWDGFLEKIKSRFHESLDHAEAACMAQMVETDYDYFTVHRAWRAMSAQIDTLTGKVDETWEDSVEDQMRDEGDFWMDESFKCARYNEYFHHAKRVFSLELEGKLSEAFYDHAITVVDKNFNCTQCNAPLEIKKDVFNAQYVDCQYCNTVNIFTPETKFAQIGWNIIDNMAAFRALAEFKAIDKIDQEITALNNNRRGADDDLTAAHTARKQAVKAYIRKVCENKAKLMPSKAGELEDNIKALEAQWDL